MNWICLTPRPLVHWPTCRLARTDLRRVSNASSCRLFRPPIGELRRARKVNCDQRRRRMTSNNKRRLRAGPRPGGGTARIALASSGQCAPSSANSSKRSGRCVDSTLAAAAGLRPPTARVRSWRCERREPLATIGCEDDWLELNLEDVAHCSRWQI